MKGADRRGGPAEFWLDFLRDFSGSPRYGDGIGMAPKRGSLNPSTSTLSIGRTTMTDTDTDTRVSVIMGVRQNDPDRWKEFYAIYNPMLLSYMRKQGLSYSDAHDTVQDVFLRLIQKISSYDRTRARFRSWLFSVARNALIDQARRRAAQKRAVDGWVARVVRGDPQEDREMEMLFERMHRERILQHAVETVRKRASPAAWICFEQRLFRDRPSAEIAKDLGISTDSVYVHTCRTLKKIRAICEEYDEDLGHASNHRVS